MDNNELTEKHDTSLYIEGRRLAVKSASFGGIVLGFLYLILVYVNTYLIEKIDAPLNIATILMTLVAAIFITLIAVAMVYFPARFMGGRLANSLEIDACNYTLSERSAIAKGAQFGVIASCMICLPILILEFLFILFTQHGEILPGLLQSVEAIIIAAIAGGWTGKQLERLIIK